MYSNKTDFNLSMFSYPPFGMSNSAFILLQKDSAQALSYLCIITHKKDNALAERVNGIIKNEFYPKRVYQNHKVASKAIARIIQIYNGKRPHASVDYLTPEQAHEREGQLSKRWKTYRKKKKHVPESSEV